MLNHSQGGFDCYVITQLIYFIKTVIILLNLVHTYILQKIQLQVYASCVIVLPLKTLSVTM